jgi:hypothetical protein
MAKNASYLLQKVPRHAKDHALQPPKLPRLAHECLIDCGAYRIKEECFAADCPSAGVTA